MVEDENKVGGVGDPITVPGRILVNTSPKRSQTYPTILTLFFLES